MKTSEAALFRVISDERVERKTAGPDLIYAKSMLEDFIEQKSESGCFRVTPAMSELNGHLLKLFDSMRNP